VEEEEPQGGDEEDRRGNEERPRQVEQGAPPGARPSSVVERALLDQALPDLLPGRVHAGGRDRRPLGNLREPIEGEDQLRALRAGHQMLPDHKVLFVCQLVSIVRNQILNAGMGVRIMALANLLSEQSKRVNQGGLVIAHGSLLLPPTGINPNLFSDLFSRLMKMGFHSAIEIRINTAISRYLRPFT